MAENVGFVKCFLKELLRKNSTGTDRQLLLRLFSDGRRNGGTSSNQFYFILTAESAAEFGTFNILRS